jgi:glycosyltransferase involved in cell wall biosynthesis
LLYLNSLWEPTFTLIPVLAARLGFLRVGTILVAPRGELSPGALAVKARKKRLFLRAWKPLLKRMGVKWHASTDLEALDIFTTFPGAQITVNGDQVTLPVEALPAGSEHDGPIRFVSISRISHMKNLLLAVEALQRLSSPAEFDIYGPVEDPHYWSRCKSVIDDLPRCVRVSYRGELAHGDVRNSFSRYDAFLLPTLGENFGHVIAESLSASCPVVCSDRTPWTDVLRAGGGVVLSDLTPEAWASTLQELSLMSPGERVAAKKSAGETYLDWNTSRLRFNILDEVRLDLMRP